MKFFINLLLFFINIPLGMLVSIYFSIDKSKKNLIISNLFFVLLALTIKPTYGDSIRYFRIYELIPKGLEGITFIYNGFGNGLGKVLYMIIALFKTYKIDYLYIPALLILVVSTIRYKIFLKILDKKNKNYKVTIFIYFLFSYFIRLISSLRSLTGASLIIMGFIYIYYLKEKKGYFILLLGMLFHDFFFILVIVILLLSKINITKKIYSYKIFFIIFFYPILKKTAYLLSTKDKLIYKFSSYLQRSNFYVGVNTNKYSLLIFVLNKIIMILIIIYLIKNKNKFLKLNKELYKIIFTIVIIYLMFFLSSIVSGRIEMLLFILAGFILAIDVSTERNKVKIISLKSLIIFTTTILMMFYILITTYGIYIQSEEDFNRIPKIIYTPGIIYYFNFDYNYENIILKVPLSSRKLLTEK